MARNSGFVSGGEDGTQDTDGNYLPPHNLEAEQCTLAAMLVEGEAVAVASDLITASSFYTESHRTICTAIMGLHERGERADIVATTEALRAVGKLEAIGGPAYLMKMMKVLPTAVNIGTYARIVAEKHRLRRIVESVRAATRSIGEGKDSTEVAEALVHACVEIVAESDGGFENVAKLLPNRVKQLQEIRDGKRLPYPMGHPGLDRFTGGLDGGNVVVIGGLASVGKSALMFSLSHNLASRGQHTAVISIEMGSPQAVDRWLAIEAQVDHFAMRRPAIVTGQSLPLDGWNRLDTAIKAPFAKNIQLRCPPSVGVAGIEASLTRLTLHRPVSHVFIDYLQLIKRPPVDNEAQALATVIQGLKRVAKTLNVCLYVISAMNREASNKVMAKHNVGGPGMHQLRGSGQIEYDADVVLLLDRAEGATEMTIHIAKNREGPTGRIKTDFDPVTASIPSARPALEVEP